jgi:hypothetical protein
VLLRARPTHLVDEDIDGLIELERAEDLIDRMRPLAALAQEDSAFPDLELDRGPRGQAELVADGDRERDLAFGRDDAFHEGIVKEILLYFKGKA